MMKYQLFGKKFTVAMGVDQWSAKKQREVWVPKGAGVSCKERLYWGKS
ncbi:MAG: hypothetical protein Q8O53_03485 [Candidatus Moranbacteria bacterium]|nr:hypothetical protein [Candidatus Moranbacteria bacterium]